MKQHFEAELVGRGPGGAWTFLPIPFDVEKACGSKARVAVIGTINGFAFRGSLLPNGDGTHSMPVGKDLQAGARAKAGDRVSVTMELDTAPRVVATPPDLQAALQTAPPLAEAYAKLSYSHQKEFVDWITQAKKAETRARRVEKALAMLAARKSPKG